MMSESYFPSKFHLRFFQTYYSCLHEDTPPVLLGANINTSTGGKKS